MKKKEKNKEKPKTAMNFLKYSLVCYCLSVISMIVGGEIIVNDDLEWECPNCHNKDKNKMNVARRTCGYLGENFWNVGKTKEIKDRVTHL